MKRKAGCREMEGEKKGVCKTSGGKVERKVLGLI